MEYISKKYQPCPLCGNNKINKYHKNKNRDYFQCGTCSLVFVLREQALSPEKEKEEYDLHRNDPHDPAYRKFLNRLFLPVIEKLKPGSFGLDFGSGPGPALPLMFEEAGHSMRIYDKFYAKNETVLSESYDFITASEVVEHLHSPEEELNMLWDCLKPGGILGIMTKLVIDRSAFKKWHYKDDPTHICFFSKPTFNWLADLLKTEPVFVYKDVVIFNKPESN